MNFEMPKESFERMTALKTRIEASSNAEVIRRALQLYEFVIEEADKGAELSVKYPNEDEDNYRPIF